MLREGHAVPAIKTEMPAGLIVRIDQKEQGKGRLRADQDRICAHCAARSASFCGMVPNADLAELSGQARPHRLERRKTLLRQGEDSPHVYIVTSGVLQLNQMSADGRRLVIGFAIAGDLVGSFLTSCSDYSAEAVDSVYLCQFPRQEFMRFVSRDSGLTMALARVVHDELQRARGHMALIAQNSAERKMAQFLLAFRGRQNRPDGARAILPVRIPQIDIADYLGLTSETVNRMLARFVRESLIAMGDNSIEILDLPALQRIADGASTGA